MNLKDIPWLEIIILISTLISILISALYSKPYEQRLLAIFYFLLLSSITFFIVWTRERIMNYVIFSLYLLIVSLGISYYILN